MTSAAAATFCATVVDEWARWGCTEAVVAPGSRSTPLVLALAGDGRFRVHVFHDERAAAFAALGLGLATGRPVPLVCTSGTAATHLHAAVVEAGLSNVPLVACTANRPPELWQVGAPQTIDQTRLFGPAVRFHAQPGVPDPVTAGTWRSLASRVMAEAMGASGRPGPVHLDLSFREPLVAAVEALPPGRPDGGPWHRFEPGLPTPDRSTLSRLASRLGGRRGVVVAGAGTGDPAGVEALARALGWPVVADHRSGCRDLPQAVAHADALLRMPGFAAGLRPEAVLRLGQPLASKVLGQWLAASGADQVAIDRYGSWWDPDRSAAEVVTGDPGGVAAALAPLVEPGPHGDLDRWLSADRAAAGAIEGVLAGCPHPTEPGAARAALDAVPAGGALVVASSMPVRDLEWFGGRRGDVAVYANRGANGIDGAVSTAIGVALTGRPTVCLLGDVAFLHDASALTALRHRPTNMTVVVVDNDGGGIFSFLPQAGDLPAGVFEALFGTPHGTDLVGLAAAHGLPAEEATGTDVAVAAAVARAVGAGGNRVVVVRTDRAGNLALHQRLARAVAESVV